MDPNEEISITEARKIQPDFEVGEDDESEFIEGEKDCTNYLQGMFDDWQAQGITSVLHEKKGGYAFNKDSIKALENKSTSNGVQVMKGVKVTA